MRILISGAGIAGPALAWWLARLDHQITVVDINPDILTKGQNIDLSGPAITVIKRMGLEQRIRDLNTTEIGTRFMDEVGRTMARFDLASGASPTSAFEILRGDLARILYEATKSHSNINYRFSTTVKTIVSNSTESITVGLSSRLDGTTSTETYDLAIACDGQNSPLRRLAFPDSAVSYVDKNAYITYFSVPRLPSDDRYWRWQITLNRRSVSARPDCHDNTHAMFMLMPRDSAQKAAWEAVTRAGAEEQAALIKSEFADASDLAARFCGEVQNATDLHVSALKQVKMTRWSEGRVVCVGDAAWAPTPLTGQGTTLAIVGAYCLAGQLGEAGDAVNEKGKGGDGKVEKALKKWDGDLRPWVEKTQSIPWFVPGVMHPSGWLQRSLLFSIVWIASWIVAVPWVAKMMDDNGDEENQGTFKLPKYSILEQKLAAEKR